MLSRYVTLAASLTPKSTYVADYPMMHQLTFSEGIAQMKSDGLTEPAMTLSRATAAGGWRHGANWDGDHDCQYADYLSHLYNNLDAQLSGQLWWTVDTGGFFCQGSEETLSRDFMLSATQPIMRQHGARDTRIWGECGRLQTSFPWTRSSHRCCCDA